MSDNISNKIKSLIEYLNRCTKAYDEGNPIISDKEWDDKYFELKSLEKEFNLIFNNSPTQSISYQVVNALEKITHNHDMLSLEKTKEIEEVNSFLGSKNYLAMCKMDGLTCSLTYQNGELISAETRGNGKIGENILHNAKVIPSIPKFIPYLGTLIIDGEIICSKFDFKDFENEYANPRNFASGSIRLLDAEECSKRKLQFVAWEIIEGLEYSKNLSEKLKYLSNCGFTIVPFYEGPVIVLDNAPSNPEEMIDYLIKEANQYGYPIDGIVFKFNDIEYGRSLGQTAHHFKNAIAYKFYDEVVVSYLEDIDWTMGRTGILTPVAIFKPIELEGSTINRASVHNLSILKEVLGKPYVGQKVEIFKANMIIPQIKNAEKANSEDLNYISIPKFCPICGKPTEEKTDFNSTFLICGNPNCEGKLINKLDHFCGKKGLDIKGLSKATLDKLISWGWVNSIIDIMTLKNYRSEWIKMPGFGVKSVDKILEAIETSKNTSLDIFISSLGIPLIGQTVSKELVKYINTYEDFRNKVETRFDFSVYDGFAESKTVAIWSYDYSEADKVYSYLTFKEQVKENNELTCEGLKVVITGKLTQFKNRNELKAIIEKHGGKVIDSISKNTNYLINNDINSTSSKNQSAKKLGIPIITEQDFAQKYLIF